MAIERLNEFEEEFAPEEPEILELPKDAFYDDGDIFWGHCVVVSIDQRDEEWAPGL